MSNKIHQYLSEIPIESTAHLAGCKQVFLKGQREAPGEGTKKMTATL